MEKFLRKKAELHPQKKRRKSHRNNTVVVAV
jgi:hypothetical protein